MRITKNKVKTSRGTIEYHRSGGTGKPNIVLINGGSGPIEGWMRILPGLPESASVFAYNRLGISGSDKPTEPQDGISIVETLREALTLVGLKPPYLLVGHSLGGLYANLYARLYPEETAGVIFLEASHPKDLTLNESQGSVVKALNKLLSAFDFLSPHKKFDEVHFVKDTAGHIHQHAAFPQVPVYVITGGKENRMMPQEVRDKRREHQLELLTLSPHSKHVIAGNSGHFPQLTEPNVVLDTIGECMKACDLH